MNNLLTKQVIHLLCNCIRNEAHGGTVGRLLKHLILHYKVELAHYPNCMLLD